MQELSSARNPILQHVVSLVKDKKARQQEERVVVAGENLVRDLAKTHPFERLFVADRSRIPPGAKFTECYQVPAELLEKVCGVPTVAAELRLPEPSSLALLQVQAQRLLVLDAVSDPGNLGTLLRSAQAFGWQGVYFLDGCCDPFNDKALRAAKGATFHLPYAEGTWEELTAMGEWRRLVADLSGEAPEGLADGSPTLLVLGSEARGPRQEVRWDARSVAIPMASGVDSLNVAVAGSLLMYLLGASGSSSKERTNGR